MPCTSWLESNLWEASLHSLTTNLVSWPLNSLLTIKSMGPSTTLIIVAINWSTKLESCRMSRMLGDYEILESLMLSANGVDSYPTRAICCLRDFKLKFFISLSSMSKSAKPILADNRISINLIMVDLWHPTLLIFPCHTTIGTKSRVPCKHFHAVLFTIYPRIRALWWGSEQ